MYENVYLKLSIYTVFLKNRNFISKIRISKVTDNAALSESKERLLHVHSFIGRMLLEDIRFVISDIGNVPLFFRSFYVSRTQKVYSGTVQYTCTLPSAHCSSWTCCGGICG